MSLRVPAIFAASLAAIAAGVLALSTANGAQTAPDPRSAEAARKAIAAEDFTAARTALKRLSEADGRATLEAVADECELDAACDRAEAMIEAAQYQQAATLLAAALQKAGAAKTARARANCLHAVALVRVDEVSGATAQFLAALKAALSAGNLSFEKLGKLRKEVVDKIENWLSEVKTATLALEVSASAYQLTAALSAADAIEKKVADMREALAAVEIKFERGEWLRLRDKVESECRPLLDRAAIATASMQFYQRNWGEARRLCEEGLIRSPENRELAAMRSKIDDWTGDRRINEVPGFPGR
jgi:hypothetical protein